MRSIICLISCKDKEGVISKITDFIQINKGNIISLHQYVDRENGMFFMRIKWSVKTLKLSIEEIRLLFKNLLDHDSNSKINLFKDSDRPNMAIMCSKDKHCLMDILSRHKLSEFNIEIPLIISNHKSVESIAKLLNIPFYYFNLKENNKKDVEDSQIELMKKYNIDFISLARYMQILSPNFVSKFLNNIINIHHSFLPAFIGAKPYHAAFKRGVKIIGATTHYVTSELDAGPIITQSIIDISHEYGLEELVKKGRELEKSSLSKAIMLHSERRILVYNSKTIIFE